MILIKLIYDLSNNKNSLLTHAIEIKRELFVQCQGAVDRGIGEFPPIGITPHQTFGKLKQ